MKNEQHGCVLLLKLITDRHRVSCRHTERSRQRNSLSRAHVAEEGGRGRAGLAEHLCDRHRSLHRSE